VLAINHDDRGRCAYHLGHQHIGEDSDNATMRNTLGQLCDRMQKGETFSDAITDYPKVFNQLFCAMISAGEKGGTLPTSLNRLAHYFDNRDKLIRKVKTRWPTRYLFCAS